MAVDSVYDSGAGDLSTYNTASHGSPLFDFLTAFAPRKLKDLFRLCEYLYFNSSQIYAALQKFCTYPVTHVLYETPNATLKAYYEDLHNKTLKIKRVLLRAAIDKFVYGNAFFSMYTPFIRMLRCPACHTATNIQQINYVFKLKALTFAYTCGNCHTRVNVDETGVEDRKLSRADLITVIRWDPKLIDIDYNPITGHSEYFYNIPKDLKTRCESGSKHIIDTMPLDFLKAIRRDEIFKFAEGQIFHMKMDAPAGIEAQWGFPPLASTIKLFFYAAVLRKANEAIALDYVVPLRIVSPKQATANADPMTTLSLARWSDEMKTNVKKWRRDPLHIMWSPIPAEVTHLGGQARALMTLGEIQAAEDNIIAAMGLPKEFIYGGFSAMGSGIQLRVLENQLLHQTGDLNDLLQWVTDNCAQQLGRDTVKVALAPFRFIDDVQQKTLLLQLNGADLTTGPWISKRTLGEAFEIDPAKERQYRLTEAIEDAQTAQTLARQLQKQQDSLSAQARGANAPTPDLSYDQQAVIAQADQLVAQLQGLDPGTRRSQLHALQTEDLVMYAVVKERLQTNQNQQEQAALTQIRQDDAATDPPA